LELKSVIKFRINLKTNTLATSIWKQGKWNRIDFYVYDITLEKLDSFINIYKKLKDNVNKLKELQAKIINNSMYDRPKITGFIQDY
jgi:hypothetical protein